MDALRRFIRFELSEGPRLRNAILATTLGAAVHHYGSDSGDGGSHQEPPGIEKHTAKWRSTAYRDRGYSRKELHAFVREAARRHDVDAAFIDAIIRAESNYDPDAVSGVGAQGIMQMMPGTSRYMGLVDPFDAAEAIDKGTRFIRKLLDMFSGDYELAAAAYNAGPGNVRKYDGVPPFKETQTYVKRVKANMDASPFAR